MKKSVLVVISLLLMASTIISVNAKTTSGGAVASAIRLYKSGNYVQSYSAFQNLVKKDPSNAVAYYYLAMSSAQLGRKDEAIENYSKVIDLSTNRQLTQYATKGKNCLESAEKCNEPASAEDEDESFIRSKFGSGFSNQARSDFEKKKIENLMREINRNEDVSPSKFKEYKDFSGQAPTNDEIVAALRTLQRAGLGNMISGNYVSDLSNVNGKYDEMQMLNLLTGNGASNLSPQVIQTLLTNQLNTGF